MESLDFTQPAQSAVYDAAAATAFFEAAGTPETVVAGTRFFAEHQQRGFFAGDDRMYLLVEGAVALSLGGRPLDVVKPGEIFGELATITNARRSATAVARTDCRVIALDGANFLEAIRRTPGFALMMMSILIDRLRLTLARLALQKRLPAGAAAERRVFDEGTLDEIAARLGNPPPLRFAAGQTIINAGDAGTLMYFVRVGRVAISAAGRTLETVGAGGVFGEMSLVDRGARSASAAALTECAVLAANRAQLIHLVEDNPEFALSLLKVVGLRLQALTLPAAGGADAPVRAA